MDAAVWTVACCRCLGVRRRMQLPAYDHRCPLVRNDESGNPHAPARLYGVFTATGVGALLGAALAGLAASKIGTGTLRLASRLRV